MNILVKRLEFVLEFLKASGEENLSLGTSWMFALLTKPQIISSI